MKDASYRRHVAIVATAVALLATATLLAESLGAAATVPAPQPRPEGWHPYGEATYDWSAGNARTGRYSVGVAGSTGELAGWSRLIAVRADRTYQFGAWLKSDSPHALAAIQFLNADRNPISTPIVSAPPKQQDQWIAVQTAKTRPPAEAYFARLILGLQGRADGQAWFDDVQLMIQPVAGAAAPNLVPNGDCESVEDSTLTGWQVRLRAETVAGEGSSVHGVKTEEGHALRLAIDRRGHGREAEPKQMVATASPGGHQPAAAPKFTYTPPGWQGLAAYLPVLAGADYELSFRYRPFWQRGGAGANRYLFLDVHFRGPLSSDWHVSNMLIGGLRENLHFADGLSDWQTKRLSFTAAEGVERCFLTFGLSAWMAQSDHGWVLIDDLQLLPLDAELTNVSFEQSASVPEIVITRQQVTTLFGNRPARLLIHYPGDRSPPKGGVAGPLYYIELQREPLELVQLVDDAEGGLVGDPFLSPDGTRAAYSNGGRIFVVHITPGAADRTQVVEQGYDQRWWVHPVTGEEYILYVDTMFGTEDSIDGTTYLQQIERGGGRPVGQPKVLLADHAFRGGRSPCGRYTCTALPGRAFAELKPLATEAALIDVLYSDRRMCNASISQDPAQPTRWLWLNEAHDIIHVNDADKTVMRIHAPPGRQYRNLQWGEWSTHPDFITASPSAFNDDATPAIHDAWIYQWSTKTWTQATRKAGTTHLWVAQDPADSKPAALAPRPGDNPVAEAGGELADQGDGAGWPGSADGLLFAWRDGKNPPVARNAAGEPLFRTYWQPEMRGLALLDGHFNFRLAGGSFVAEPLAEPIAKAVKQARALTLQLVVIPSETPPDEPRAVLQFGQAGKPVPLAIVQQAGQLELWSDPPLVEGKALRLPLMPLTAGEPVSVAIVIEGRRLAIYQNGVVVHREEREDLDLSQWPDVPLQFGTGARDEGWRGRLSHLALHAAALPPTTIAAAAADFLALGRTRPAIERAVVEARLTEASTTPPPADTTYTRGYSVHAYELVRVISGNFKDTQFRVAHWSEMGDQALAPAQYQAGQVLTLILEPFEAHPELEREQVFDTLPLEFDVPIFYDAGPITIRQSQP